MMISLQLCAIFLIATIQYKVNQLNHKRMNTNVKKSDSNVFSHMNVGDLSSFAGKTPLAYLCVQAKEGSLEGYTMTDGVID